LHIYFILFLVPYILDVVTVKLQRGYLVIWYESSVVVLPEKPNVMNMIYKFNQGSHWECCVI